LITPESQEERDAADEQRSIEYDALRPEYGEFLLDEVIPFAEQAMDCSVNSDPDKRLVADMRIGGIALFTAAWFHTEAFARVLCHCWSFTNIKGGHTLARCSRILCDGCFAKSNALNRTFKIDFQNRIL